MIGYAYLFRNGDLYNIGCAQNFELIKKQLKPDEVIAVLKAEDVEKIREKLHNRYGDVRLPKSDYFRLNEVQKEECLRYLLASGGSHDFKPFFRGPILVVTFLIAWVGISALLIKLFFQPIFDRFI